MTQILRQSTQVVVRIGPAVAVGDGFTPVTSLTLSGADEAEALKAAGAATTDISGATFAAITGADGWYNLTLTTSHTDTIGTLDVVVNDDSLILPIFRSFQVIEEAAYDAIYAASASPATAAGVSAVETDTQDIQSRLPAALVSGRIDASVGAMAANVMTAAAAAADLTTELQSGLATAAALDTVDNFLDTEIAAILAAVDTEVAAIKAVTDALPDAGALTSLATAAALATVDGVVDAILVDTAEIGAAGAGLTVLATAAALDTVDNLIDTEVAAIKTVVDAIQAKTDSLTFTVAGQVDANIESVNGTTVTGSGTEGDPWGP